MLGWYLYFIFACRTELFDNLLCRLYLLCKLSSHWYSRTSRFWTILEKNSFKVFATSFSLDSIISLLSKMIDALDLTLPKRKGLTVCQNCLLSVTSFYFSFIKYSFFSFLRREAQRFLRLLQSNFFSSAGFFKNLFL